MGRSGCRFWYCSGGLGCTGDSVGKGGDFGGKNAIAVRDSKKFFKRIGRFVRQSWNDKKTFQRSRDDKNGKSDRKCFRCSDLNNLIGECPKPPKEKNQREFVGGSLSDSDQAIKVAEKQALENDIDDETQEIDEIANIKESKNHPLEKVIGNLNQRTLRNKLDENNVVSHNKARLVTQGYNQQEGIDYNETYASVTRIKSIRILLAYACALYFMLFQMDVKSAFLNGFINEEVYVVQPLGFIYFEKPDHVYKLKKALYGLKQAPKAWYDKLKSFLIKHEYNMGMVDNMLFSKKKSSNLIIIQIHVDDIIFSSTYQDMCDDFAKIMHDNFEMNMMGELNFFLGLQLKQMKDGIFFNQSKYIKEMLKKFGLEDSMLMKTLMSSDTKLTKEKECESVDITKYRGMIGCCLTSWFLKKETDIAISTTEAEYVSDEKACQQALWMKRALIDYEIGLNDVLILCDNKGTLDLSKNPMQHSTMDMKIDQQVALDEALVPHASRLRFGKSNFHLRSDITSKESTLQVVYDVLRQTLFYKAFLVTAGVPEIYMQEFWAPATVPHHSIRSNMKQETDELMFTTIKLVSRHQNTQQFDATLLVELTNEDMRNSAAYKEYYAIASGAAPPKIKASVKKMQSSYDTTMPPPKAVDIRLSTSAEGKQSAKSSKAKDEVTGIIPGVPDVPTYESDEEISWKLSDEDNDDDYDVDDQSDAIADDDDDQEDEDEQDDDDQDDNDDDQDSDNDDDDFVHPKLSIHDEESFDPIVQTLSHVENSNDETNDDESYGMNVRGDERPNAKYDDEELYGDVNINLEGQNIQMINVHTTQVLKDIHVTLTPVNPDGQQQSSSMFDHHLKTLEANFSEFMQTNQFAKAVSSIPALVDAYKCDKIILDTYGDTVTLKKRRDDEDKDKPSAGSDRGSKRSRAGKEPESTSAPKEKASKTSGKSIEGAKSHQKTASESTPVEEPMQTTQDLEEPAHLEFEIATHRSIQPWISDLAKQADSRTSFNELMDTLVDFSAFMMNWLKVDTLSPELLAGPTYELMKGLCKSLVELELFLKEVYKATTDQLDWNNPEGQLYPHNLLKPLPLIPNS
uniref:Copia protein n=1 Tax=Tanacetum cinerariifolium TaxID=118510 RepID=A0A699GW91_TANCI|nr:copia protein [Tanacetum cinerariifolium]